MANLMELSKQEKRTLRSMFIRSHLVFITFNMVKMEANGFTATMQPALEEIYKDDLEGKKEAYLRHQNFFNTHAVPFSFIAGLSYAMEKEHKEKQSIDGKTIESIKASLMGPTAGIFDSLFFNCIRIIIAGVAIGLCSQGNIIGSLLFILVYGIGQSACKYVLTTVGYSFGTSFIDTVYNSGLMKALTKAASVLGLIMVGAMTASMVNVPLKLVITTGSTQVVLSDVINSIMPGLLSIVLIFVLFKLIRMKFRPTQLVIGILVIALVGAFVGIF